MYVGARVSARGRPRRRRERRRVYAGVHSGGPSSGICGSGGGGDSPVTAVTSAAATRWRAAAAAGAVAAAADSAAATNAVTVSAAAVVSEGMCKAWWASHAGFESLCGRGDRDRVSQLSAAGAGMLPWVAGRRVWGRAGSVHGAVQCCAGLAPAELEEIVQHGWRVAALLVRVLAMQVVGLPLRFPLPRRSADAPQPLFHAQRALPRASRGCAPPAVAKKGFYNDQMRRNQVCNRSHGPCCFSMIMTARPGAMWWPWDKL